MAKQNIDSTRWYSLAEAADAVGISPRQLRRYFQHPERGKRLKSELRRKDGTVGVRVRMIKGADLLAWLERV